MRIRPGVLYRNLIVVLGCAVILYATYYIFSSGDYDHDTVHRRQKHLYLTVSKDRITDRFDKLAPKRILMWTKVFREKKKFGLDDCKGYSDRCIITYNHTFLEPADAVVFHAADLPDGPLPDAKLRHPRQKYVFLSMESPLNTGVYAVPLDYFNWTATHLLSSDVISKYGPFFITTEAAEKKGFKIQSFHLDVPFPKKKSGILGFVSNCETKSKRELAISALSKYINVTIGGKCASRKEDIDLCPRGADCNQMYGEYPFFLAIENTVCKDYITEKYWDKMMIPSIPIVMRRKIYEASNFPPRSFIALDDYASPAEMAEHLLKLQSDRKAYMEYFAWRNGGWTVAPWNAPGYRSLFCRLCERLWEEKPEEKVVGTS
ncbi:unnamed protein product [Nippostrongylus brasiliensis]|uniref:Fucosyltransferase n=1 Tax=Nippostrongylus brasiliensis TaxID=27835 RepID=A0A0N4Y4M6_NIPBR|nr:unnamed protein product [Nippostrongylus brasiliensis]